MSFLEPQKKILFGTYVIIDVINSVYISSCLYMRGGKEAQRYKGNGKSNKIKKLEEKIKRKIKLKRQKHKEDAHVKMEAEFGAVQAPTSQAGARAASKREKLGQGNSPPLKPQEKYGRADTFLWDFQPQERRKHKFCSKPSSSWLCSSSHRKLIHLVFD